MGHFHAWLCPEILRCGSISMFFAQICAQTSDRLEFWVVDLPVHKQRQNDRFINKQKVLSHVLLHLPGTTATGRRWTNASILRWDASREIPDWYEKAMTQQHSCTYEDLASFLGIKVKDSNNLWVIPTNINITRRKHTNESGRKLYQSPIKARQAWHLWVLNIKTNNETVLVVCFVISLSSPAHSATDISNFKSIKYAGGWSVMKNMTQSCPLWSCLVSTLWSATHALTLTLT